MFILSHHNEMHYFLHIRKSNNQYVVFLIIILRDLVIDKSKFVEVMFVSNHHQCTLDVSTLGNTVESRHRGTVAMFPGLMTICLTHILCCILPWHSHSKNLKFLSFIQICCSGTCSFRNKTIIT